MGPLEPYSRLDQQWIAALCCPGQRPIVVTSWLRILLTGHFQKYNIEDQSQAIQKLIWNPTDTTGIKIESFTKWDPALIEKRAAIILKRNGWKRIKHGIGDRKSQTQQGQEVLSNAWGGSHTCFCIAGNGAEAEKLGAEVYRFFNQFSQAIRETLNLLKFELTEVGEVMILEEARQNFVVPVVVAYAWSEDWLLLRERPSLTNLDLNLIQP